MSDSIFGHDGNKIVRLNLPGNSRPAVITTTDSKFRPVLSSAIITSLRLDQKENVQFSQALNNKTYVYAFGSRVGTVDISGMVCTDGASQCDGGEIATLSDLLAAYKANKASARGSEVINIAVAGSATISGYLVGSTVNISSESSGMSGLAQFSFQLAAVSIL